MNVSVLGGTGEQGRGLAQRLARAGQSVMIGSRSADRAQSIAAEIGSGVAGGSNEDAARFGDIVIVAVPWDGHRELLESLAADLAGKIVVELIGRINKCGVISPRFDVCHDEIEQWVVNLLPARTFGHIILTTSYGIMDHEEARRKHTGGKILGFFY